MINNLKQELNDCYMYGEIISHQGFGPKTDITMREMIKFDLLQFLAYLLDSSNTNLYPEINFFHQYLGEYFTAERLLRFRSDRVLNDKFLIAFEIGQVQGAAIESLAHQHLNNITVSIETDMQGLDRFVFIKSN